MLVVVGTAIVGPQGLLAQERAFPPEVAGMWEVPGGRVEPGETDEEAVVRECMEELGVTVKVGERVGADVPLREDLVLRVYAAQLVDGEPTAREHRTLRWLTAAELSTVTWLPADEALLPDLRVLLA
ncbi:(deoxy)nucleoside triphosphate pyrophosphohydrolase [Actinokineospora cianjurensis]|uniref:8-oxo-dGTP diphosphatase n=1 Tax=Actinokineospora cianjurensis TaxID=585224 RepID=A0A421AXS6_9PSEU|nr:NUDIX domain-containing protein [Actinokineospora cianjurensis]RLK54588.1 8-oxo-dGTP diphosphatase [Actinokineospora cianjurensis]